MLALRPLGGVHRTTDGGLTWSQTGFSGVEGAILRRTGDTVSLVVPALFSTSVAWISQDRGDSWLTVPGLPLGMGNFLSGDGTLLFAPTHSIIGRLLFSATAGQNWQDLPTDGLTLSGQTIGQLTPLQMLKLGNSLFLIGNEWIDASFNTASKLYRLDLTGFDFRPTTTIITQPVRAGGLVGNPVTLSDYAVGLDLSYQWFQDGEPIDGATSAELTIANPTAADTGDYTVVVTGDRGAPATSTPVRVTIVAERIDGQLDRSFLPDSLSVTRITRLPDGTFLGVRPIAPSRFTRFDLDGKIVLVGFFNRVGGQSFPGIVRLLPNGSIDTTYDTSASYTNNTVYGLAYVPAGYLLLGSSSSSATFQGQSGLGVARVYSQRPALAFMNVPVARRVSIGGSTTLRVEAGGTSTLSYQWLRNGVPLPGATESTLTLSDFSLAQTGTYTVRIANESGFLLSGPILVNAIGAPEIVTPPAGASLVAGENFTLSVDVDGVGPFDYAWFRNDEPVTGATSSTLALNNVQPAQAGIYRAVISNAFGTTETPPVTITVNTLTGVRDTAFTPNPDSGQVDQIRLHPDGSLDTSFTAHSSVSTSQDVLTMQLLAGGKILLGGTFQSWPGTNSTHAGVRSVLLNPNCTIDPFYRPGPFNSTVSSLLALPEGRFYAGGAFTSPGSRLSAFNLQPADLAITAQPRSIVADLGGTAEFDVGIYTSATATYQWLKNGDDIPDATEPILALTAIETSAAGLYDVVVSNDLDDVVAGPAALAVVAPVGVPDPSFTVAGSGPDNSIFTITPLSNGRIALGGGFLNFSGQARQRFAILESDGTLVNLASNPTLTGATSALIEQPDGKILIGWGFGWRRINADGTTDTGFNPTSMQVNAMAINTTHVYVGGYVNASQSSLRRFFLVNGAEDTAFTTATAGAGFNGVRTVALRLRADGTIVAINANGLTRRLLATGAIDPDFTAETR